jgi:hypothetical protein
MDPWSLSLGLALQTRDLLRSLGTPVLAPFLAAWPDSHHPGPLAHRKDGWVATSAVKLPVLGWMADVAGDEDIFGASIVADLCRHAQSLTWRQTYTARDTGEEFMRNYGYAEILGPGAPLAAARIACGFLLLGPATLYPRHSHEAEEVYVPLSGTARWQQGDARWRERPPGTVIHHASEEPHAMHTGARPLLALYVWRSDNLDQTAKLETGASIQ